MTEEKELNKLEAEAVKLKTAEPPKEAAREFFKYHRLSGGRDNAFKDMLTKMRQELSSTAEITNREPDKGILGGIFGKGDKR